MKTISGRRGGTLTPWQKGQSGNPKGIPKGYKRMVTRLKEVANIKIDYKDIRKRTRKMHVGEAVVTALIARAIYAADLDAIELILKHIDSDLPCSDNTLVSNNIQNNYQQNIINTVNTGNPLNLSDAKVLKIAEIMEMPDNG